MADSMDIILLGIGILIGIGFATFIILANNRQQPVYSQPTYVQVPQSLVRG